VTARRFHYRPDLSHQAERLRAERAEAEKTADGRSAWNWKLHDLLTTVRDLDDADAIDEFAGTFRVHFFTTTRARK
jgi:cyclopropane fatty-acyl-phospholipid synthase-like methyltransferase